MSPTDVYIRNTVNRKYRLSPHEILMGRPMWLSHPALLTVTYETNRYCSSEILSAINEMFKDFPQRPERCFTRTHHWSLSLIEIRRLSLHLGIPVRTYASAALEETSLVLVITNAAIMCKGLLDGSMLPRVKGSPHLQTQCRAYHLSQQNWMIWMNILSSNVNRSIVYSPANRLLSSSEPADCFQKL